MDANVFPYFLFEFSPSAHFLASCWECFPLTKLNKFLSVNVQCNNYCFQTQALLRVKNDILLNMNKQHVTLLVLLDLSVAFDTVNHNVLLSRLHSKFGISGTALEWFRSYLNGRSQHIMVHGNLSRSSNLDFGVPQGSCLGPLLFTIYASKLFDVIKVHLPTVHCYPDDTQLYVSFSPT